MRLKIWCKGHLNYVAFKKNLHYHSSTSLVQWIIFPESDDSCFQILCKDAYSFKTPTDFLIQPEFQDWAVAEYCWNCLNILPLLCFEGTFFPLYSFRMEKHNKNLRYNLHKIHLFPSFSIGLLQLYFSTYTLLAHSSYRVLFNDYQT